MWRNTIQSSAKIYYTGLVNGDGDDDNYEEENNDVVVDEKTQANLMPRSYAKGVFSAYATDHHQKDGQCLNQ